MGENDDCGSGYEKRENISICPEFVLVRFMSHVELLGVDNWLWNFSRELGVFSREK